jgi:hypothetical protein
MRGSSVQQSFATLKKIYLGALLMNWRIWTVTQWLSFHYIPPHFRVLWGKLNYINYKKATVLVTFIYLYLLCTKATVLHFGGMRTYLLHKNKYSVDHIIYIKRYVDYIKNILCKLLYIAESCM